MFYSYSAQALLVASHIFSTQAVAIPERRLDAHHFRFNHHGVKAFDKATANRKTDNYVALNRRAGQSKSSEYLHKLRNARNPQKRDGGSSTPLISAGGGVEFLTQITFGTTAVDVIVDTGSSDTWLIQSNFKCVDASGTAQAQSACNFGPTYPGTFGSNKIPNANFNISYGDGEFVTGDFGTEDITLAGITVPSQTVSAKILNKTYTS
jgi:aspergillopepsin I